MKVFANKGMHLACLSLPAKLVYSFFLVLIGLGIWTSVEIYAVRVPGDEEIRERYCGEAGDSAPEPGDGPALDLPEEEPDDEPAIAAPSAAEMKWPWLLDVAHQHAFSISVVFLILAHLFMLTRLTPWLSGAVIAVGGLSSLAHVLAPLIIHGAPSATWLMPVTGAAMGLSWCAMAGYSLLAMWLGLGMANGNGNGGGNGGKVR